jgi:hypothetical protein
MTARIPTHVHQPDGIKVRPLSDEEGCRACPLPAGHPVHNVPDRPPEERAAEARRIGEHDT